MMPTKNDPMRLPPIGVNGCIKMPSFVTESGGGMPNAIMLYLVYEKREREMKKSGRKTKERRIVFIVHFALKNAFVDHDLFMHRFLDASPGMNQHHLRRFIKLYYVFYAAISCIRYFCHLQRSKCPI